MVRGLRKERQTDRQMARPAASMGLAELGGRSEHGSVSSSVSRNTTDLALGSGVTDKSAPVDCCNCAL